MTLYVHYLLIELDNFVCAVYWQRQIHGENVRVKVCNNLIENCIRAKVLSQISF